jgi:predicted DNA-binding transcriptional regulator AlpA
MRNLLLAAITVELYVSDIGSVKPQDGAMRQNTTTPLLEPPDVAEFLGVPVATLSQWRYFGRGPAYISVGKHVRYRTADIEAWLEAQTHRGGAPGAA